MNLAALTQDLSAFAQVLVIDVALAGDNAVVVGMAVAGLPARQQRPAIILGIGGLWAQGNVICDHLNRGKAVITWKIYIEREREDLLRSVGTTVTVVSWR